MALVDVRMIALAPRRLHVILRIAVLFPWSLPCPKRPAFSKLLDAFAKLGSHRGQLLLKTSFILEVL
jgi:hypothetical protein